MLFLFRAIDDVEYLLSLESERSLATINGFFPAADEYDATLTLPNS